MKKNRTLIIVIILCIAGALYGLYPTWKSQDYQSTLDSFGKDSAKRAAYIAKHEEDVRSLNTGVVRPIKLGLDLRGGIYITMEVDVLKFIEEQASNKDEILNAVLAATSKEEQTSDETVVSIFSRKFQEIAASKGKTLANYFLLDDVKTGEDKEIIASLTKGSDEAVDRAIEIIRNRIDQYGLTEPTIQKFGSRRIIIEVPGAADPASVRQLLEGTAQLEFRLLKDPKIVRRVIDRIDKYLSSTGFVTTPDSAKATVADSVKQPGVIAQGTDSSKKAAETKSAKKEDKKAIAKADTTKKDSTAAKTATLSPEDSAQRADSLAYAGLSDQQKAAKFTKEHPFTALIAKGQTKSGQYYVSDADRRAMLEILARPDIKPMYEGEVDFSFSRPIKDQGGSNFYEVYFLNAQPELTGKYIVDAGAELRDGKPTVTMRMNEDGARIWSRVTDANVNHRIAIVLDNVVYSAPNVMSRIDGGNSEISGSRDMAEANLLKIVLKAGALPAPVKIIQQQEIGASLGADSVSKGLQSILIGFLVVIIFMAMYYLTGGFVADVAVIINLIFTLAVLAAFGATLTLPGMAGIVLTVGIAVDANVLIYERVREELASGKSLKLAIDDGYKRAFAPIFDGHLTAFFSGVILYSMGTGTVQGFGVTLMIGIAASLFTAIVITRVIFDILLERMPSSIKFG
ncbi:MAG: protein translocase subunit SecD [Bacteroidetes bacterium]|nr:protein translocase subunit SecD [Bacteroidota bacterium]